MRAGAWLVAGVVTLLPTAPRQQVPTFSAKTDVVRVDVLVTDRGQPVGGLTASDFEVFDNDVPQQVELVSFENVPLNVVFVLDESASLSGGRLDHLRTACESVLDGLHRGDQSALVTFGHGVVVRSALTPDAGVVRRALAEAHAGGKTPLIDAAYTALILGESDAGRSLLILFSDGVDTVSWLTSDQVLRTAERSDAVVYGVQLFRRGSFLSGLSRATGGEVFAVSSTQDLASAFTRILEQFRQRYLVSYTPANVARGGWHALRVGVKPADGRSFTVMARPGYLGGQE